MTLCGFGVLCLGGAEAVEAVDAVELRLRTLQEAWKSPQASVEIGWKLAQACFDRAEFATNRTERSSLAERGIEASKSVLSRDSNSAPGHFFLAMNLGQLARTRHLSALGLVTDMEVHFLATIALDPSFLRGAAHRSLGMLYRDAPGWPASIGSRSKARRYLEKACELHPLYPENLLTLMESELGWGERKRVSARLSGLDALMAKGVQGSQSAEGSDNWKEWRARAELVRRQATGSQRLDPGPASKGR